MDMLAAGACFDHDGDGICDSCSRSMLPDSGVRMAQWPAGEAPSVEALTDALANMTTSRDSALREADRWHQSSNLWSGIAGHMGWLNCPTHNREIMAKVNALHHTEAK